MILLVGLQGSGKTTAAAKLAHYLDGQGRRPLLVAADLQRPAAVEQLRVLGEPADVPVSSDGTDPVAVAPGRPRAKPSGSARTVVIVDTAGRLQIDDDLMDELRRVVDAVAPARHAAHPRRHDRPGGGRRRDRRSRRTCR